MVVSNACEDVKSDLQSGSYTLYTKDFPIYIKDKDKFKGGNVFIFLLNGNRNPIQVVNGPVLYTPRSCDIMIRASSSEILDNLRDDVEKIILATSRGYVINDEYDYPDAENIFRIVMSVSMSL